MESELFGYAEGAFTGARRHGYKGKFEQADGGTIFLDEIGEVPPEMQVALLRVLQERTVTPIGSSKEIPVNIRIITATHKDLLRLVEEGKFRQDLYYRLHVYPLYVPSLIERKRIFRTSYNIFVNERIGMLHFRRVFVISFHSIHGPEIFENY